MKHFFLTALSVLTLSATPALAVVIDFESQSGFYNSATPSSVFSGIVFDRDLQVLAGTSVAAGPGQSGQVARASTPPFGSTPRGGDIGGLFDGFTVSSLSFVVGDACCDLDVFQLLGYDSSNNLVADSGLLSSVSAITVSITGTGITRFLLEIGTNTLSNQGSSVIDNINFDIEPTAVPEPSIIALFGLGLVGLGFARRRRQS